MTRTRRSTIFWGVALVVAGLVFLLINLNVIPASRAEWWPVLVIAGGLWLLAEAIARRGPGLVGGVVLTSVGTYWLLDHLGQVERSLFLPVLLISLGTGLVLRQWLAGRPSR